MALVLLQTRFGPGAAGDSTSYLMGAENLLAGNGFSRFSGGYELKPITGFPPFYSSVLAGIGALGVDLQTSARVLNGLLLASNVLLIVGLVESFSRSFWAAFAAGALFLVQETQFVLHTWVMSEPLYIFLTLAAAVALSYSIRSGRWSWLLLAAGLTGLSSLTRLVGPAMTAAGFLCLVLFRPHGYRTALARAAAFAILSLLPLWLWMGRNAGAAGTAINRELGYHPLEPDILRLFLAEASSWFVPHEVPLPTGIRAALAILIGATLLGGLFLLGVRNWIVLRGLSVDLTGPEGAKLPAIPWVLGLYAAMNVLVLFVNSTFLDASTTVAAPPRYLSPVFAALVVLAGCALSQWRRLGAYASAARWLGAAYAAALFLLFASNTLQILRNPFPYLGYTGRKQTWHGVVQALESIPPGTPIVSNNPEIVYVLADRPAYVRPILFDNYQEILREDYEAQFTFLVGVLEDGGYFVVFDEVESEDQAFIDRLHLELIEFFPDYNVRIYGLASTSEVNEARAMRCLLGRHARAGESHAG